MATGGGENLFGDRKCFISANESPPVPLHKLRWYQFSLRSMFIVMTLFAMGLGLYIKYVKQANEKWARTEYFLLSAVNSENYVQWPKAPTELIQCGGGSSSKSMGDRVCGESRRECTLENPSDSEPAECVAAFMQYLAEKNILDGPKSLEISKNQMTLRSPEGWLKMEAKWLPDNTFVRDVRAEGKNMRRMQFQWEFEFRPLYPPSEKQKVPKQQSMRIGNPLG